MNTTKKLGITVCAVVIALVVLADNVIILPPAPETTSERSGWKLPPKVERFEKRFLRTERQLQRAYELAEQMGVARDDGISLHAEGHVPTRVNGTPVPMHLLTEEERTRVEAARTLKRTMDSIDSGESPITLESMPIDTSNY